MEHQIKEILRDCRAFVDQTSLSDWPEEFDVFEETSAASVAALSD